MLYFSAPTDTVESLTTGTIVGIAVASTAVVVSLAEVVIAILVYYCICKHQSQSSKLESSSHQHQQASPVYEEVPVTSDSGKIELQENTAYGPVKH